LAEGLLWKLAPTGTRSAPKLDRRIPYEKPHDFGTIQ